MEKIGIFGGTFDPIHKEHICIAKTAVKELNLDKLIIVPSFISPHKADKKTANSFHRLNMCNLAFNFDSKITVSDFEILNEGKSFSYLTVEHFSKEYANAKMFFIIGADMFIDFVNWKNPDLILNYCTLAVVRREKQIKNIKKAVDDFYKVFNKRVNVLKYIGGDTSSTKVRRLCCLKQNLDKYVTYNVAEYIIKYNLYTDNICEYVKNNMNEKRFIHTMGVVELAVKYSEKFNVNSEKAFYAAVLHDIAKGHENEYNYNFSPDITFPVYHQFLGAEIAKNKLLIEDEEILNAIKYHTSGRENMTNLDKLIFVADMLEEGRDFKGINSLRKLLNNPELCFKKCLERQYKYLISTKKQIYNLTTKAYKYYCN
jgi:nicotinate-nucleotide adenylyltransferase